MTAREEARRLWRSFDRVRAHCLNVGISSWEGLWADFAGDDPNLAWLRDIKHDYRREPWACALEHFGIDDPELAVNLGDAFVRKREAIVDIYSDVERTLDHLKDGFQLAILTNGLSDLQRKKIRASGLASYFDVTVISGDLGEGKPCPAVFQHTLDLLGVPASQAMMVGDNIERDVRGAQEVGITGVWINRDQEENATDVSPDLTIVSLEDLVRETR